METLVFYRRLVFYKLSKIESGLLNELEVSAFWPKLCLQINQQEGEQGRLRALIDYSVTVSSQLSGFSMLF